MAESGPFPILELPPEILQKTLAFLSYDEISGVRAVNRKFNNAAIVLLNAGFQRVERSHSGIMHHVKSQLPRRESERRNHALARHNDILTAVETRLSLLNMTFNKFVEAELCCFIPGKVLDEIFAVLREVRRCLEAGTEPQRPHELLTELRDISSMAMEHFDENISPHLRERASAVGSARSSRDSCRGGAAMCSLALLGAVPSRWSGGVPSAPSASGSLPPLGQAPPALTPEVLSDLASLRAANILTQRMTSSGSSASATPRSSQGTAVGVAEMRRELQRQSATLTVYKKELAALKATHTRTQNKLKEQGRQLSEQTRKLEEFAKKYDAMFAELVPPAAPSRPPAIDKEEEEEEREETTAAPSPPITRSRKRRVTADPAAKEKSAPAKKRNRQ